MRVDRAAVAARLDGIERAQIRRNRGVFEFDCPLEVFAQVVERIHRHEGVPVVEGEVRIIAVPDDPSPVAVQALPLWRRFHPQARPGSAAREAIARVRPRAVIERQAAASDALGHAVLEPLELRNALVGSVLSRRPRVWPSLPARARDSAAAWQARARISVERQPDLLREDDERNHAQHRRANSVDARLRCARSGSGPRPRKTAGLTWPRRSRRHLADRQRLRSFDESAADSA